MKRARRKKGGEEKRNCTLGLNLYSGSPLARSPMCPKNVAVLARVFCTKKCMAVVARRPKKVVFLCTYQCNAGGGSGGAGGVGRAWSGDLIVFVGPAVGHLTDPVLPGEGIFEFFFARRGDILLPTRTKKTEAEHMFPRFHASRMRRTVWKNPEIMEANGNKRKLSGFYCFVFKFRLF